MYKNYLLFFLISSCIYPMDKDTSSHENGWNYAMLIDKIKNTHPAVAANIAMATACALGIAVDSTYLGTGALSVVSGIEGCISLLSAYKIQHQVDLQNRLEKLKSIYSQTPDYQRELSTLKKECEDETLALAVALNALALSGTIVGTLENAFKQNEFVAGCAAFLSLFHISNIAVVAKSLDAIGKKIELLSKKKT